MSLKDRQWHFELEQKSVGDRTVSAGSRRRQISGSINLVVAAFRRATAEELSRESVVICGSRSLAYSFSLGFLVVVRVSCCR